MHIAHKDRVHISLISREWTEQDGERAERRRGKKGTMKKKKEIGMSKEGGHTEEGMQKPLIYKCRFV